jgi:hypothetical protein
MNAPTAEGVSSTFVTRIAQEEFSVARSDRVQRVQIIAIKRTRVRLGLLSAGRPY